jgi:sulfofructose kinase
VVAPTFSAFPLQGCLFRKIRLALFAFPASSFTLHDYPMRSPKKFDVLGIGENAADTVHKLARFPAPGHKAEILSTQILLGGQVATAVIACRRWGLRAHYVGCVGDDRAGELHRRALRRERIPFHLAISPNTQSHLSLIFVDQQTGERTIAWHRDQRLRIQPSFLQRDWVTSARLLYIDGHDPAATRQAARWARAAKIPVIGDFDRWSLALARVLPLVDYPVVSRDFPAAATGESDLLKALPLLKRKFGNHAVCATLGIDGALAWDGRRFWYSPSYKVRVVDTTGAGDLFHAGFSFGILQRWELQRILDFACAAAGLNCESLGARGGIATLQKIERLQRKGQRNRAAFP